MIGYAVAGVLVLGLLDRAVGSGASGARASGALGLVGKAVDWIVSPSVPGIPNLAASKATGATKAAKAPENVPKRNLDGRGESPPGGPVNNFPTPIHK